MIRQGSPNETRKKTMDGVSERSVIQCRWF